MLGGLLMVFIGVAYLIFWDSFDMKSERSADLNTKTGNVFSRSMIGTQVNIFDLLYDQYN